MIFTVPFPINEAADEIFDPICYLLVLLFCHFFFIKTLHTRYVSVESTFDALLLGILIPDMACGWVFALHKGVFFFLSLRLLFSHQLKKSNDRFWIPDCT